MCYNVFLFLFLSFFFSSVAAQRKSRCGELKVLKSEEERTYLYNFKSMGKAEFASVRFEATTPPIPCCEFCQLWYARFSCLIADRSWRVSEILGVLPELKGEWAQIDSSMLGPSALVMPSHSGCSWSAWITKDTQPSIWVLSQTSLRERNASHCPKHLLLQ